MAHSLLSIPEVGVFLDDGTRRTSSPVFRRKTMRRAVFSCSVICGAPRSSSRRKSFSPPGPRKPILLKGVSGVPDSPHQTFDGSVEVQSQVRRIRIWNRGDQKSELHLRGHRWPWRVWICRPNPLLQLEECGSSRPRALLLPHCGARVGTRRAFPSSTGLGPFLP